MLISMSKGLHVNLLFGIGVSRQAKIHIHQHGLVPLQLLVLSFVFIFVFLPFLLHHVFFLFLFLVFLRNIWIPRGQKDTREPNGVTMSRVVIRFPYQLWTHFKSMVMWLVCSFSSLMAQATGSPAAWASLTIMPISVQSTWLASALRTTCSALSTTGRLISTSSPFILSTSCNTWHKISWICIWAMSR